MTETGTPPRSKKRCETTQRLALHAAATSTAASPPALMAVGRMEQRITPAVTPATDASRVQERPCSPNHTDSAYVKTSAVLFPTDFTHVHAGRRPVSAWKYVVANFVGLPQPDPPPMPPAAAAAGPALGL